MFKSSKINSIIFLYLEAIIAANTGTCFNKYRNIKM